MSCHSCHNDTCTCCDPNNEPLSSALDNFIKAFFGTLTKTCVDGKIVWTLPCDLETGCTNFPRNAGEGLACYLLRLYASGVDCSLPTPPGPDPTPPLGDCACQALQVSPSNPYPHGGGSGVIEMILAQSCKTTVASDSSWLHPVAPFATDMPFARSHMGITTIGNLTYLAGGNEDNGTHPGLNTDDFWSYNMDTNTWTVLAPMPTVLTYGRLVNDGTFIYMQGGYVYDPNNSKTYHYRYTIATNTWDTTRAPLPQQRSYYSSFRVGDFTYLFGGLTGPGYSGGPISNNAWRYSISGDTWDTTLANMPYPTWGAAQEAVLHNGYLYVVGGFDRPELFVFLPHNRALRYHIATDTWERLPDMPATFGNGAMGLIGDTLWAMGGGNVSLAENTNIYKFDIPTMTWSEACCDLSKPRAAGSIAVSPTNIIYFFGGGSEAGGGAGVYADVEVMPETTFIDFTVDANTGAQRSGNILVSCYDTGVLVERSVNIIQS